MSENHIYQWTPSASATTESNSSMWLRGHNLSINFVLAFGAFGVQ
jgi:hypothetical protein